MDITDKTRLAKLLGMLGSSFDGERANAGRMIQAMAEKYKLNITELIEKAHAAPPRTGANQYGAFRQAPPPPPPPKHKPKSANGGFHKVRDTDEANENLRKFDQLIEEEDSSDFSRFTDWERQFIRDVADRYEHDYELSDKQLNIVFRILQKAERGGVRWGT